MPMQITTSAFARSFAAWRLDSSNLLRVDGRRKRYPAEEVVIPRPCRRGAVVRFDCLFLQILRDFGACTLQTSSLIDP